MSDRRVLVTGASGFIGRHVLSPLLERGFEVHAVSSRTPPSETGGLRWHRADLLGASCPGELLDDVRPTHLLHLAWYTEHARVWTSPENLRWVGATLRLVQAFAERGGERAVLAGTCAEYRWGGAGPCIEGRTRLEPATLYGTCKNATRGLLAAAAAELGIAVAWGRVFFVYGPDEAPARLVPSIARALLAGERAPTGDGSRVRDVLHVVDVAGAFAALLDSNVAGAVNIGSGERVALLDVIERVAAGARRPDLLDIGALPGRPGDPRELVASVARLRDEVGFAPVFDLAEGIGATVAWWREERVA